MWSEECGALARSIELSGAVLARLLGYRKLRQHDISPSNPKSSTGCNDCFDSDAIGICPLPDPLRKGGDICGVVKAQAIPLLLATHDLSR